MLEVSANTRPAGTSAKDTQIGQPILIERQEARTGHGHPPRTLLPVRVRARQNHHDLYCSDRISDEPEQTGGVRGQQDDLGHHKEDERKLG